MSLSYLLQRFDALGPLDRRAPVRIDQSFIGSTAIIAMFQSVLGTDALTIDVVTDLILRSDDQFVLVGTASLLNLTDAQVTFTAKNVNDELFVKIEITIPPGWMFSTTFPDLPEQEPLFDIGFVEACAPHFLDQLSLGAAKLIVSNMAYEDEALGCNIVPGLNFVGELYFMGVLYTLGFLLQQDDAVSLTGPLQQYRLAKEPMQFAGIRLSAPFRIPMSNIGPLSIRSSHVYVKSGLNQYDMDYVVSATQEPGIYVLMSAELAGRPLELVGKYDFQSKTDVFSVRGRFTDFAVSGFAGVSQSVGVDGFGETMPEDFPVPDGLSITEFGVSINTIEQSIVGLLLGIGCQLEWAVIPNVMTLREISATFYVANPFEKTRSIQTSLAGLLAFKKFSLAASATFPTYEFTAGLPQGETLPLGDVIESFLPQTTDLPDLTITKLVVRANPKASKYSINAAIENLLSIPVGLTSFDIAGLSLAIAYDKAAGGATGALTTRMTIAEATVVVSGELNKAFTLTGSVENFDLKKFWALVTNGETIPDEIPNIIFSALAVSITPKTGAFSLLGTTTIVWDHFGEGASVDATVQFSFSTSKVGTARTIDASLSLQALGSVHVARGFDFVAMNLLFNYQSASGWSLSGGIGADVFDTRLDLQVGYETVAGVQKFKLRSTANPPKKLIGLAGVGSYSFQQLDLGVERRMVGEKRKTFFDLRLASRLELDKLFAIDGYLSLMDGADGQRALLFRPNPGTAGFKIDFPTGQGMGIKADVFEVGMVKDAATGVWGFSGTINVGFNGFPAFLGAALPSKVTAKLVASTSEVRISALNVTDPVNVQFPKANGKDLGRATVQLTEVGISVKPQLGLVIEAGLGLPAELNTYLGAQIFRVYQPGNPTTMARTRFTIAAAGVTIQFIGSPFAAANSIVVNGDTWFDVDFGQYGAIRLKMPTFIYDGVSQYFEAGGGIQITRTLALPLAPLRIFLEACGAQAMADIFPKKIPIEGLVLVDSNNDLKVDEFVNFLKKAGGVPNDVVKTLKQTGKVLNRFPDGFKQYFNLQIPDSLEFKFGFSPTGRITIGMLAPKKPVRVLFPCVVQSYVPMPGLCGIEVRKFVVGTLLAGSLLYGEVDAIIDQFDLPSLVVSLALPTDPDFPLPTSDQLQRRIILDDVFCIIPISAGLPVPIPLFYDEIGFEYLGVEGIGLQAHVAFPKPALGGAQATAMFQALKNFTSDHKMLLDPKTPPGGLDLAFSFHDEYLQAPEYLGGKLLGTKGKTIKVGTWKNVASMMNFCKTFSVNDCIQSIPIEQRVGSAEYRFAFMKFDADWMLTTPAEFKSGAYQQMKLSPSDVDDFVTVLPSVAMTGGSQVQGNEEGIVAFVRGQADLGFLRLEAALGLAASGSMGFNTGFKFEGAIGKIVFELEGAVMVNAPYAGSAPSQVLVTQVEPSSSFSPRSAGKALALNGKNAWIEIPASDSLVLPEYTIELWIRSTKDQTGEWVEMFGADTLQNGSQRNHYLEINAKKAFYHHRFKDAKSGNSGAPNTPDGSVTWEKWQHVALTNDGTTAKTYIDGKEVASGPVNGSLVLFKESIFIGKVPGTGTNKFWKGQIAEVRIWKSAREADDIEEFMREMLQGDEKDLVSCYQFDADTGGKAIDICGRNHGTITNGKFVDSDLLRFEGLEFDGKSTYIEVPDAESLRVGPYTVEAWVKPFVPEEKLEDIIAKRIRVAGRMFGTKAKKVNTKPVWAGIFGKTGRNYSLIIHRNGFVHHRFHTTKGPNDGAPNTADGVIEWNQWNHITITNDGKVARTYLNGVLVAEGPVEGNNLIIDKGTVVIGRTADAPAETFAGEIAEIRLWSGARSVDEIKNNAFKRIAGNTANLVSLWRMGDVEGNTLVDICGRNHGRLFVKPKKNANTIASLEHDGLVFNGTSDYVTIDASDKFKTDKYTIETWVRPDKDASSQWQCVWGAGGAGPKVYVSKDGVVSYRYTANVTETIMEKQKVGGVTVSVPKITTSVKSRMLNTDVGLLRFGEWNHVAVTTDGTACKIYIDGNVRAQGLMPGKLITETSAIRIGSGADGKDAFFRGSIDDIRYWSAVRSAEQILASMNAPLNGKEADLVAYYDMGHTSGAEMTDLGPSKLHGKIFGADWALVAVPSASKKAAIQIQGHTHIDVLGHRALAGDLRMVDSTFWFSGNLELFPRDWPIRVYGHVEGMVSEKRFYLSGETKNQLFGLNLQQSSLFLSNEEIRLEGRWLGLYTLLNVSWDKDDPRFAGSIGFRQTPTVDFGAIRIGGVKVSDNVRLTFDIGADVSVVVSKSGFAATVRATFTINGKGFDLSFGISVAPNSLEDLVNWIKNKIIETPLKYLAHLFSDAATWLKNIGDDTIEFAKDVGEAVGDALKSAFNKSKEETAALMKGAGYAANQVGAALGKAYNVAANDVAGVLKGAGYAAEDVGRALQAVFSYGAEDAARVLKNIGFGAEDVGKALGTAFGKSVDECEKLMKSIGFSSNDVSSALKIASNAGKTIEKGVTSTAKKLKFW